MHMYDISNMCWTDLSTPAKGQPPSPRWGHGFAELGGLLYVFSGCTSPDANGYCVPEDGACLRALGPSPLTMGAAWLPLELIARPRLREGVCGPKREGGRAAGSKWAEPCLPPHRKTPLDARRIRMYRKAASKDCPSAASA